MLVLGIDTSCDDTSIALVKSEQSGDLEVISNIVSSQTELHKGYGGVFPMLAKREHQKNLVAVLKEALQNANLLQEQAGPDYSQDKTLASILEREPELCKELIAFFAQYGKPQIDAIAVTQGPGLEPCLWVGLNFAKALNYIWNIPIIPVHHVEGHLLSAWLDKGNANKVSFPALALIVSGGHTQLILCEKIGQYKIVGETLDDAAGECFDKVARILGLGYPGGPIIEKIAKETSSINVSFPRPMLKSLNFDFSFSGLKTAVLYDAKKKCGETCDKDYAIAAAKEAQDSIVEVLVKKSIGAADKFNAKTIIIGGGVSASQYLRDELTKSVAKELSATNVVIPSRQYSTDNGAMIAAAAILHPRPKLNYQSEMPADSNFQL